MDERNLEQLFQHDFSEGTEAFRDELLERCLAELREHDEGREVEDDVLDMLAAAGEPFAKPPEDRLGLS